MITKDKKPILTLVLAAGGQPLQVERTWQSCLPLLGAVQLIMQPTENLHAHQPDATILPNSTAQNLAQLINQALSLAQGRYIAVLAPGVEVRAELPVLLHDWSQRFADAHYLYGDYVEIALNGNRMRVEVNCCPDDVTEREDWGFLEIYRTEALRGSGGCDETIRFRTDYDLRLKLTDEQPAVHISEPLCTVWQTTPPTGDAAQSLFFPGRGRFGGFSYLFLDAAEEHEIEEIFCRALKRRGAYLEQPPGGTFPPPLFSSPRVSVIIPVHNRADFLPLAVQSVQRGRFQDFEVIVVDNASTDATLAVAEELARQDGRIRVIPLSDNVIARALNAGVRQARGAYIAQLDSDDEYTADTLEVMVQQLDERLDWALAISYYELMDPQGKTLTEFGAIKHLEYNRNNILRVDGAGAVRVWRKAAIQEFGGFDEMDFGHYGEDYDLVLKVGEKYEVGRVHQVLYRYRRHPGNSDVLRPPSLKIRNKTLARQRAIRRRQLLNQKVSHE